MPDITGSIWSVKRRRLARLCCGAGIVLTLVIACALAVQDEPPYTFLLQAKFEDAVIQPRLGYQTRSLSGKTGDFLHRWYYAKSDEDELEQRAESELTPLSGWSKERVSTGTEQGVYFTKPTGELVAILPDVGGTVVIVQRKAIAIDRVRVWLRKVTYRGPITRRYHVTE